jgi:hypothetical protein
MDQKIGLGDSSQVREVDEVLKNGGKVLNTKMLFKRKYGIVGIRGPLTWTCTCRRSFQASHHLAFSAVRMLVALTVDPRFSVESYDLSGAFLGTSRRIELKPIHFAEVAGVSKLRCIEGQVLESRIRDSTYPV